MNFRLQNMRKNVIIMDLLIVLWLIEMNLSLHLRKINKSKFIQNNNFIQHFTFDTTN